MASSNIQLQKILDLPHYQRCTELSRILQELSLKDLQALFPFIVENIFGFGGESGGWGLNRLTLTNRPRDFEVVRNFLGPDGPLLHLAYKLPIFGEGLLRYEFPFSCLPIATRHMLEEGVIPLFYSNKLHYQAPGRLPSSVLLNPFEYYLFHFAYFIVNPQQQHWILIHPSEALYSCLLDAYLQAFLPTDSSAVSSFSPNLILPQSTYSASQYLGYNSPPSPHSHHHPSSPSHHYRSLLKQSPALLKMSPSPSTPAPSPGTVIGSEQIETWRSETLVLVLTEFWLNQSTVELYRGSYTPNLEQYIPSHDHMQMVRNFIKYLHYFANSARPILSATGYAYEQMNGMEIFKCTVIQQFVQKRLYKFLRLTFDKWPLDASFRLPLETWLSYIQPWRYITLLGDKQHLPQEDEQGQTVNPRWQKFVSDNLLFYTAIFQQLLPRFLRMELTSPKNAYMLFRVTKVFSQPSLSTMIEEVESTLQEPLSRLSSAHSWSSTTETSFLPSRPSLRSTRDVTIAGNLRQQILEMEGPGFKFVPLFGEEVCKQINFLLYYVNEARENSLRMLERNEEPSKGFFSKFVNFFSITNDTNGGEDYSPADNKKVEQYLRTSSDNLSAIFRIHPQSYSIQQTQANITAVEKSSNLPPDCVLENERPTLTDLGRYQLINKLRKANVAYQGNPDLQPIRSYEITFLVRLLWHISFLLNEKFGREFVKVYHEPGFLGRISRQVLSPPTTYYRLKKSKQEFQYVAEHLPPRINLRWLAHKQTVGYFLAYFCAAYIYGYGTFVIILLVLLCFMLIVILKALFADVQISEPQNSHLSFQETSNPDSSLRSL